MSSNIVFHDEFDDLGGKAGANVFEVFPPVFNDNRGFFCEVLKEGSKDWPDEQMEWFKGLKWIKQINRSMSRGKTVRGCHAQRGKFCQAKLVQAVTAKIYDIITDARPNSKTFGVSQVFILDPEKQNQLFIPKGFLHAFAAIDDKPAIFEYMCDEVFDKSSEVGVNPLSILPKVVEELERLSKESPKIANDYFDLFMLFKSVEDLNLSEKDLTAPDYETWMKQVEEEYLQTRKLWYA